MQRATMTEDEPCQMSETWPACAEPLVSLVAETNTAKVVLVQENHPPKDLLRRKMLQDL